MIGSPPARTVRSRAPRITATSADSARISVMPRLDAEVIGQDALAHQLLGQRPVRGADFLSRPA